MATGSDPYAPYARPVAGEPSLKETKLGVDIASGQQGIAKSKEEVRLDRERFLADLAKQGLMLTPEGKVVPRPGGPIGVTTRSSDSAERTKALAQVSAAQALDKAILDMEKAYYAGPGRTHGVAGVVDFLPLPGNKSFDKSAAANRGIVKNAQNLTGGELNTAAEAEAALGPFIPSSTSYDSSNQQAFARLRDLRDKAWRLGVQTLGGIPDVNGNVTPLDTSKVTDAIEVAPWLERENKNPQTQDQNAAAAAAQQGTPAASAPANPYPPEMSALNQAGAFGTPLKAAGVDAEQVSKPMPEEMQAEHQEWLAKHPRGTLRLSDYANFRNALDIKYGFGAHDFASDPRTKDFIEGYNGSGPVNVTIPPNLSKDERNALSKTAGAAIMTPAGTAATTALSGAGLNVADMVLPEQMQALRELNPNAAVVGDVLGSIGGTKALSKVGETLTEKLLAKYPSLLKKVMSQGKVASAARNLLTDTAQGAIYGGATEGDAGTGALSGAFGNVLGQGFGTVGGSFLRGLTRTPEADLLLKYGVPDLTVGQQLGGKARALEDAATSVPLVGDVINARRGESLIGANEAAFRNVAGEPIGYGEQALQALGDIRRRQYNDALNSRTFDLDTPEFKADMANALAARSNLTDEFMGKFDTAIRNALEGTPGGQTGKMTGEGYQQSQRKLSGYKAAAQQPGFEQDYRDALSGVSNVLRDTVEAQAPEIIPSLAAADKMYRGEKILEKAMEKGRFDTLGLGADVFRPRDLTQAVYESAGKYHGEVPLDEFSAAMQNVLPSKMPDSGTARRAMLGALTIGGLGAVTGAGTSAAEGNNLSDIVTSGGQGAAVPLTAMAILAAGGSKAGQRMLTKALFSRPKWSQALGDLTSKYAPSVSPGLTPVLMQGTEPGENELGWYDAETDTVTLPDGSRINRDGTPVVEKAKGGRVKAARSKSELMARYSR